MISELEALYISVDKIRMSEADRHMAKVRLAQADAFAGLLLGGVDLVKRLLGSRPRRRPLRPTSA